MVPMVFAIAVVLLLCVTSSKLLYRYGVPTLLIFLLLGMLFGSDGPVGIYFDNYVLAQQVCSFGLIFIMFYGGFGTSWKTVVLPFCVAYFPAGGVAHRLSDCLHRCRFGVCHPPFPGFEPLRRPGPSSGD